MPPRVMKARAPVLASVPRRPPLSAAPVPSEHAFQMAVRDFLDVALPAGCWWSAVDAGAGKLSKAAAGRRKARGVKAGFPDIVVIFDGRILGIELKRPRGAGVRAGVASEVQGDVAAAWNAAGAPVRVCRSVEEVCRALVAFGIRVRVPLARLEGVA